LSTIIPDVAIDKPGNSYLIVPVVNPSSSLLKIYDNQGHLLRKWTIKDIVTAEHVTVDGTGNIYISGNWTVKKYDQQGNLLATVLTYPENQFQNLIDGLTTDGQNNLLVAVRNEVSLDKIVNRILRFDSQAKALGQWDVNVPGQDLVQYEHLAVDSQGNVFVAPYFGSFVAKFSAQGQFITKWTGASDLTFERDIQSLALDTQGNILLSLANQSFILKLDSQGKYLARLAAPGDAEFKCPNSLAWIGNALYASDSFLGKVLKFDANGQFKGLIAVPGSYSEGALTGLLTNGQNLYLWKGSTIYRYNAQGQAQGKLDITLPSITSRVAIDGNEKVYPVIIGLKGGVYLADRAFDRILALVVDREGTLYVAASQQIGYSDYFLGLFSTPRLYKFKAGQPGYLSQWSKDGTADEEFRSAVMTLDTQNNLYLLDSYLGRVQKFDKEGKLLAKWSNADLKNISAFQIDETGHLYGVKGCDIVKITLS
jgi:sugar lactone lactonase YvrE